MQLIHETDLSADAYTSTQAWKGARLARCPNHPDGGCRFARHGTYGRKTPAGIRIARHYCPDSQTTFSLLPQFLAAGMPGTLQSVEDAVAAAETAGGLEAGAAQARPGHHGCRRAARRWIRRRVTTVHLLLATAIGLLPDLLAGTPVQVGAFRERTGSGSVLVTLRQLCADRLQALPAPVGFRRVSGGAGTQTGPPAADGPFREPLPEPTCP